MRSSKKVKLVLHQLEKLGNEGKCDGDQQSEVISLISPSVWFSDSEQPLSPGSVWSFIEGAEHSGEENGQGDEADDEADDEESEVELLNSHLKERLFRGREKRSGSGREKMIEIDVMHC